MTAAARFSGSAALDLPILRDLDETSRQSIAAADRMVDLAPGDVLYREGDPGEVIYAVLSGAVSLRAVRRSDRDATVLRIARSSDTFGEEAALAGLARRFTAMAEQATTLVEIPVSVFQRATARAPIAESSDREQRYLRREILRDLLAASALSHGLPAEDAAALLDAARLESFARTERLFELGDRADDVFVVLEGLIQIQTEQDDRVTVQAYLSRGDLVGDEDALSGAMRSAAAVSMGDSWCARISAAALRRVSDRNPALLRSVRRVQQDRRSIHEGIVDAASARSTQHVFNDLYRMQMARSLLVIDQDSCVRCGHCAWSCAETHGISRLVRRGDRVIARLRTDAAAAGPSALLVPNSCQQCRNAACMIDCPTGAIGRDLRGEVFIREDRCTGCTNCAKACPWDNIQMAPRAQVAPGLSETIAVKCDLCRDYEAPACVQACPTESLLRLDPSRDIAEVQQILGGVDAPTAGRKRGDAALWIGAAAGAALAIGGFGLARQLAGGWTPGSGAGLAFGVAAGLLVVALASYSVPKRIVSLWMKRRRKGLRAADPRVARSRTRPHMIAHLGLGLVAAGCALAHAGWRLPAGPAGVLVASFWLAALLGAAGGLMYWLIPARLSRLERRGDLPEDLGAQRRALIDRLYRESTGRSDLVKTISTRILIPYARSALGPLALVASGRSLGQEQERLRGRVDAILEGRGGERLRGLDELIKTVVESRALPARRWMSRALRAWLPIHIVVSAVALGTLVVHIALEVLW